MGHSASSTADSLFGIRPTRRRTGTIMRVKNTRKKCLVWEVEPDRVGGGSEGSTLGTLVFRMNDVIFEKDKQLLLELFHPTDHKEVHPLVAAEQVRCSFLPGKDEESGGAYRFANQVRLLLVQGLGGEFVVISGQLGLVAK